MDLILYSMLIVALLIALISFMIYRQRNWLSSGQSIEQTLAACRSLLALIAGIQQHRGMSSAWLAGDQSFKPRLDAKAREIEHLIPLLRDAAREEGRRAHPCLTLNELSLFQFNWTKMRDMLRGLSVEQSIAQHSFLVDQLLKWLGAMGESRVELVLGQKCERGLVRNYASRLPALTECLGQARALGTSVAAKQGCSAVARVRLMFLIARAEALLSQAAEAGGQGRKAEQAKAAVQEMARVVRTQMLLSSSIALPAPAYFALATTAIDSVFSWIDECGTQITQASLRRQGAQQSVLLQRV